MKNKSGNTVIHVSKSDLMVFGYYRSETGHGPFIRRRVPVIQISSQYAGLNCTNIAELPSNDSNIVGNIKNHRIFPVYGFYWPRFWMTGTNLGRGHFGRKMLRSMFASVLLATNCTRSLSSNKTTRAKRGKALLPLEKPYFPSKPVSQTKVLGRLYGQ